ncbi:hypothetical protein JG688_00006494 [Phytophthora aleatoria]|uniref:HECT domain-containing protein n=1 Tax=Phytophthora aleatoria TaxID=2496075 RepID=A0A8J5J762_9STRA|nr:hypothetical protein JG688_00006494 [Phytophthora aleatoria]
MQAVLGFLVVLAIIALLFFFLSLLARRAYIRRQRSLELHAPLLNSDDRRLDAALRDAEEGFNVCSVCSFENFKRFKFCTVCGEAIVGDELDGDINSGKKRTARLSFLPLFKRENKVELVTATPPKQTTRRRLRAQRRKEWTRKLDVEGRAYWFRDGRLGDTYFAGFVVKFQSANATSDTDSNSSSAQQELTVLAGGLAEEQSRNAVGEARSSLSPSECGIDSLVDKTAASSVGTDIPDPDPVNAEENTDNVERHRTHQPLVGSVEDCIAKLVRSTQEQHVVLTPPSDASVDASKLPLDIWLKSSANQDDTASTPLTETMSLAAKDFPSKYAHFVTATSALLVPAEKEHLRLNVERANVFEDSMESLAIIPLQNVHSVLRINFLDESGVDAGGLHREWFVLLNEMLVDPTRGLFTQKTSTQKCTQIYIGY